MDETIAFESKADAAGFTIMPNVVLLDTELSVAGRLLYGLLVHFARQEGSCFPGQRKLAELLGVGDRAVRNYLSELEAAMLVRRDVRPGHSCRYTLLALGLREARRERARPTSPRNTVSGVPRNARSANPGTHVPTEEEAGKKDTSSLRSEDVSTRTTRPTISGKPVNRENWRRTVHALAHFNGATGRRLDALTGRGTPSDSAKRIYCRLTEWPSLDDGEVERIIDATLKSRWWKTGNPSIGVIFGQKVFEENMERRVDDPSPPASLAEEREARRKAKRARAVEDRAAMQRFMAAQDGGVA